MHTLNELNTMRRKTNRNPFLNSLSRLSKLATELKQFSEMDKISFSNGSMTSVFSGCFAQLRRPKSSTYPKLMFSGQERLEDPVLIANSFLYEETSALAPITTSLIRHRS